MPERRHTASSRLHDAAVLRRFGRIVAAGDVDFDIAEAARIAGARAVCASASARVWFGTRRKIELRRAAAGQNGLAAGAGVAGDQAFDVHGRLRGEALERLLPGRSSMKCGTPLRRFQSASLVLRAFCANELALAIGEAGARSRTSRRSRRCCRPASPKSAAPRPGATPANPPSPCCWSGCRARARGPSVRRSPPARTR